MVEYLLIHSLLSGVFILSLIFFKSGPHRASFWVCFFGMFQWLLPIETWSLNLGLSNFSHGIGRVSSDVVSFFIPLEQSVNDLTRQPSWFPFLVLSLLGIAVFMLRQGFHIFGLAQIKADKGNKRRELLGFPKGSLIVTSIGFDAFCTGILKPTLWIGRELYESRYRNIVLEHEKQHLNNRDPLKLFLMNLMGHMLWWNPFALFFWRKGRQMIEFACDSDCASRLGMDNYQQGLVAILHQKALQPYRTDLVTGVKATRNMNIRRLELISRRQTMTHLHRSVLTILVFSVFVIPVMGANLSFGKLDPPGDGEKRHGYSISLRDSSLFDVLKSALGSMGVSNAHLHGGLADIHVQGEFKYKDNLELIEILAEQYGFEFEWLDSKTVFVAAPMSVPLDRNAIPNIWSSKEKLKVEFSVKLKSGESVSQIVNSFITEPGMKTGFELEDRIVYIQLDRAQDMIKYQVWAHRKDGDRTSFSHPTVSSGLGKTVIISSGHRDPNGKGFVEFEMEMKAFSL